MAPKGTPPDVVKKLHDAFKKALEEKSSVEALAKYDMLPNYMSTEQYTAYAQTLSKQEGEIIKKLGLDKVRN